MPLGHPLIFTNIKYLIEILKKLSIQPISLQLVKFYLRKKRDAQSYSEKD